ncbi:M48 family metallopeptidase [Synechococcus sp. Nb3U1]|uniref:M48 family metallopeptidase n=1 Tax=Synechococcus sp. Nb3U1 TaxID=1914529 RepID=UPI001F45C4E2|nr:SprT family zinc-dependent metalloprotease [Synechococcus sp. Nb3U1]MCF2972197.1 M48 family metallopeptidase [Synechococcus sp. Nb3U1]
MRAEQLNLFAELAEPSPVEPWPSIRESLRARRVILTYSPRKGLELVIPTGFDRRRIPDILRTHTAWIQHKLQRPVQTAPLLPERITLPAHPTPNSRTEWTVLYQPSGSPPTWKERDGILLLNRGQDNPELCCVLLQKWLRSQAKACLDPWIHQLSRELGLPFAHLTIRSQQTRWGSCSRKGNINLNDKLLFLPTDVVRYVLIHELCHTVHLNHSAAFWKRVECHEPHYLYLKSQLKTLLDRIPAWVENSR